MRAHEGDLQPWFGFFLFRSQADFAREAGRGLERNQEVVLFTDFNGFLRRDMVWRRIQQTRSFQHSSRISKPNRIPVRLDLAGGRPARTGATIKVLKRRWIQEKRL